MENMNGFCKEPLFYLKDLLLNLVTKLVVAWDEEVYKNTF